MQTGFNNINFGRAIRIDYKKSAFGPDKQNNNVSDIFKTMTDPSSSVFDKETSRKIGTFLKAQFSDYSKKTGIYFWESKSGLYVFTGKEMEAAREIKNRTQSQIEIVKKKYPDITSTKAEEKLAEIQRKRTEALEAIVENGHGRRSDSSIAFKTTKKGNLREIEYISTRRTKNGRDIEYEVLTLL